MTKSRRCATIIIVESALLTKALSSGLQYNDYVSAQSRYDVIVIGAGIVGSSVTMALAERGKRTLTIDIDLSGRLSSSEKNAGGVRATWWEAVNITLCRASIEYYESIASEVGFRQKGYLWLYDAETWPKALAHIDLQRSLGHPIETLTANEVHQRVPEIDRLEGIEGATFRSPRDGLINPNLLKNHYRDRAQGGARSFATAFTSMRSTIAAMACASTPGMPTSR